MEFSFSFFHRSVLESRRLEIPTDERLLRSSNSLWLNYNVCLLLPSGPSESVTTLHLKSKLSNVLYWLVYVVWMSSLPLAQCKLANGNQSPNLDVSHLTP